jgi:hypothetical protein
MVRMVRFLCLHSCLRAFLWLCLRLGVRGVIAALSATTTSASPAGAVVAVTAQDTISFSPYSIYIRHVYQCHSI